MTKYEIKNSAVKVFSNYVIVKWSYSGYEVLLDSL